MIFSIRTYSALALNISTLIFRCNVSRSQEMNIHGTALQLTSNWSTRFSPSELSSVNINKNEELFYFRIRDEFENNGDQFSFRRNNRSRRVPREMITVVSRNNG